MELEERVGPPHAAEMTGAKPREHSSVDVASQAWDVVAGGAIIAGIVAAHLNNSHPYFEDLSSMWTDPAGRAFFVRAGLTGVYSRYGAPYITKFATERFDGHDVRRRAFLAGAVLAESALEYGIFERLGLDGKKSVAPFAVLGVGLIYLLDALERRGHGPEWMFERCGSALNRVGLEFGAATESLAARWRGDGAIDDYLLKPASDIMKLCR